MIPTSPVLERWLLHVAGERKLPQRLTPLEEAVELNRTGRQLVSTYGRKRFPAAIGFIDMRGFSAQARGKPPEAVRRIASPFVNTVINVAADHDCFVDKSIGDEVMLVMPSFGRDVLLADTGLRRDPVPLPIGQLVADLHQKLTTSGRGENFTAGFAVGRVVLERIGTRHYREWTVYGNTVNAAKRLQALAADHVPRNSCAGIGALIAEEPKFREVLEAWLPISDRVGSLNIAQAKVCETELKGSGRAVYIVAKLLTAPHRAKRPQTTS